MAQDGSKHCSGIAEIDVSRFPGVEVLADMDTEFGFTGSMLEV